MILFVRIFFKVRNRKGNDFLKNSSVIKCNGSGVFMFSMVGRYIGEFEMRKW